MATASESRGGDCVLCGDSKTLQHHTNYAEDETVPVCYTCHGAIHADEDHSLYPEDEKPEDFEYPSYQGTTIRVESDVRDRLRGLKVGNESYTDVLERLMDNAGWTN